MKSSEMASIPILGGKTVKNVQTDSQTMDMAETAKRYVVFEWVSESVSDILVREKLSF